MLRQGTQGQVQPAEPIADWLALPSTPAAPGLARRFLTSSLRASAPDLIEVAVLLTSELVANAVLYGRAPIWLQLQRQHGTLRVEVCDAGQPFTAFATTARSLTGEGGHGLLLLTALATTWGSRTSRDTGPGKTLWFELADHQPDPPRQHPARSHRPT